MLAGRVRIGEVAVGVAARLGLAVVAVCGLVGVAAGIARAVRTGRLTEGLIVVIASTVTTVVGSVVMLFVAWRVDSVRPSNERRDPNLTQVGVDIRLGLRGDVDVETCDALRRLLGVVARSGCGDVEVDVAEVTFIGHAGLTTLGTAYEDLSRSGRTLRIINAGRVVRRPLELADLTHLIAPPPRPG